MISGDVQAREIFITHPEFRVAAGIGTFNASFAKDYAPIAGIYFATDFTRFLDNPSIVYPVEPVQNPTSHCTTIATQRNSPACSASYFVSSGLENISPWPSKNADFPDAGAYVVKDIAGYQFDFGELQTGERFDGTKDCRIYGDDVAAIQLCISTFDENTLIASTLP